MAGALSDRMKVFKTGCEMWHGGCGIIVHVKNGKSIKIKVDRNCPNNFGYLCVKGRAILDYVYHPDRLTYPLKRIGGVALPDLCSPEYIGKGA